MDAAPDEAPLQDIEIELFVRALQLRYGYDFTQYAPASFRRRVQGLVSRLQLRNIAQLTGHVDAFGLDSDTKRAVRLVFQPVLVAWALASTDAVRVLRERRAAAG